MHIEFSRFSPDETEALVEFLTGEEWPFHASVQEAPAIRQRAAEGLYDDAESRTFWLLADGERAGLVRLQDLTDGTPMFDLRIRKAWRGRGLGTAAVKWLTSYLFTEFPGIRRIEGNTRQDNHTMRAVFRKCGYVKESHYREAWPAPDGTVHDTAGYAILRRDWESGTVTPPDWNDEPAATA
ncbi:acetyltransferase, GNAT family [[Actinomadura] parvosata subsp. kistnae]|uniref:GNAT family N-acetyltransferase n=1 Tax=[Actinomadura] parvosata subsp. kistnae TaxID=1909395 RepID=A0A1V0A5T0_9ACTN|nr:GNAT family N-acetyltransferase [Nonomuraea sp. ATCC 55076]AQZ65567.1 GNAT family N-acetyltransferase [Nonomuraea sp. ATCC 55076]SPL96935.1 acetyltransferase, GNAT family [Actinomadura parvosata subsp. kistnae]